MKIRIHKIITGSCANGPGIRNVVWFQGCTLSCPGCFNPQTHDPKGGRALSVKALCDQLLSPEAPCDGITISGGEPFQQAEALQELLAEIKTRSALPVLIFSGYTYGHLKSSAVCSRCLPFTDVLICGPYDRNIPPDHDRFCSSGNQELVLLSDYYTKGDFKNLPLGEYFLDNQGKIIISGINP